ncbi:MAG TPA: hypothetical protein VIR27_01625, partial [Mycobacteriales bacterium]
MSKRRWRASLTALAVVALTAAGTTATVRTATAAEPEPRPVEWICYLDEGSAEGEALTEEASVQTSDGRYTVALDHALCTKALPEDDGTQPELDLSYFLDRYPGLAVFKDGELPDSVTFVQCGERGGTLGSATPNSLPTVDGLRHDCSLEVPEGARSVNSDGGLGGLGGGFGGGMMWGSGDGMPTSDSVDCSSGGTLANPWAAEGSGGGKTNGQLGWQMFRQWLQGTGIAYGASKAAATGNSTGIVLGSGALSAFEAWGQSVADSVGKDLEARYRDSSASLA